MAREPIENLLGGIDGVDAEVSLRAQEKRSVETVDLSRQLGRRLLRTQFCGSSLPVEAPRHGGKPGLRNNPLGFFSGGSALGARGAAIPNLADLDGGQIESGATNRAGPRGRTAFESGHGITPLWSCIERGASSRHREAWRARVRALDFV